MKVLLRHSQTMIIGVSGARNWIASSTKKNPKHEQRSP
jgi:hypothetical protein